MLHSFFLNFIKFVTKKKNVNPIKKYIAFANLKRCYVSKKILSKFYTKFSMLKYKREVKLFSLKLDISTGKLNCIDVCYAILDMILNRSQWWWGSSSGTLGNMQYYIWH